MAFPWICCQQDPSCGSAVRYVLHVCPESVPKRGAKHDARLQAGAGSWFLGYLLLCAASIFGSSFQILQRSDVCYYLFHPFWFLPPSFLSLGRLENGRKLECIFLGRSLGLKWCFAFLATCHTLIKFPVFLCLLPSAFTSVSEYKGCCIVSILPLF